MEKKDEELRYESVDRVARWNLCQQLTSVIYKSFLTNKKIKISLKKMKKSIEKIWRVIRHNQCLAAAAVVCIALACWAYGCQSQVESMRTPDRMVTRPQLKIEVDTLLAEAKLKFEDLNRQDAFKRQLFEYGLVVAQGGSINPVGVAVSLFGILGIGTVADNRRKDGVIKGLKPKT